MRGSFLTFALATFVVVATSTGEEMPVDSGQQCSMFKRIFSYDKDLRQSDKIVVIVVGPRTDGPEVDAVVTAFREKQMYPAPVTVSGLTSDLTATLSQQSTVVYVMAGVDYDAVNAFAASHRFLSISGMPSLVESGQVSVGVDMDDSRPQVVVNMGRLTAEGHELSSELLKLARVIR